MYGPGREAVVTLGHPDTQGQMNAASHFGIASHRVDLLTDPHNMTAVLKALHAIGQ